MTTTPDPVGERSSGYFVVLRDLFTRTATVVFGPYESIYDAQHRAAVAQRKADEVKRAVTYQVVTQP